MLALLDRGRRGELVAADAARAELQPWAMFVGHCWSGAAPVPTA